MIFHTLLFNFILALFLPCFQRAPFPALVPHLAAPASAIPPGWCSASDGEGEAHGQPGAKIGWD